MTPAAEKIERCSAQMLLLYPWWASLYLHLKRVETESVLTMAVDGTHLFFNPEFTQALTDKECVGVLMHETAHCAFLHCYRKKYREHRRWNLACDMAVNAVLAAANIGLPADCVPPGPLGELAEELYEKITEQQMALYFPDDVRQAGSMDGAAGTDAKGMTEKDWRDAVAASHGLMPDYVARTVTEAMAPPRNWKEELARFIHATRKSDTKTWSRLSRRVAGLPGWAREPQGRIVICVDTSGSITGGLLNGFMAEVRSILAVSGIEAVIISADAEVHEILQPGDPLPVTLSGGGGTSFAPALTAAENYEPDACVYLTDGFGSFPQKAPPFPILWALTMPGTVEVPWGEKIILEGNFDSDAN